MLTYACMRSKAALAERVPPRLARKPRSQAARARRSHRMRVTLAAVPVLFAHAFARCHIEKENDVGGTEKTTNTYSHSFHERWSVRCEWHLTNARIVYTHKRTHD